MQFKARRSVRSASFFWRHFAAFLLLLRNLANARNFHDSLEAGKINRLIAMA